MVDSLSSSQTESGKPKVSRTSLSEGFSLKIPRSHTQTYSHEYRRSLHYRKADVFVGGIIIGFGWGGAAHEKKNPINNM